MDTQESRKSRWSFRARERIRAPRIIQYLAINARRCNNSVKEKGSGFVGVFFLDINSVKEHTSLSKRS